MIKFDNEGFALESGFITVFTTDKDGFFLEQKEEYVSEGGSLAECSYLDKAPEHKDGFVIKRVENEWQYIESHVGETYYNKETKEKIIIEEYGSIPETLTNKVPWDYTVWDNIKNDWVVDENLLKQAITDKKESLNSLIGNKVLTLINQSKEYTAFDQQRLEAQIWTLDNSNPVPLLTSISETIGMPLPELVKKCLEKTEKQSKRKGVLIGQEVEFKRKVKNATKLDELEKIEQDIQNWK